MSAKRNLCLLVHFLVLVCFDVSYGSFASSNVKFTVEPSIFSELKKPIKDQKNGMVIFYSAGGSIVMEKIASGIFPPMTRVLDSSFIELVDVIFSEKVQEFKNLYTLHTKLSDLISKLRCIKREHGSKEELQDVCGFVKQCLEKSSAIILSQDVVQKWLNVCTSKVPGNTMNKKLQSHVEKAMFHLIDSYIGKLASYYNDMLQCVPQKYKTGIVDAMQSLQNLDAKTIVGFKKFITSPKAQSLRNFAHTEDVLVYQRIKGLLPSLESQIFSLNDLCPVCREKFVIDAPAKGWLPTNVVYISLMKLNRTGETTVDYLYHRK